MDRFPEAFRRFERVVDINSFESYRELRASFAYWCGFRWQNTYAQNRALAEMAQVRGFEDVFIPYGVRDRFKPERRRGYKRRSTARRKWKRKVRVTKVQKSVKWYVNHKYSANRIQRRLQKRGLGIRRKTLLRYVREAKGTKLKANSWKYNPKKPKRRKK